MLGGGMTCLLLAVLLADFLFEKAFAPRKDDEHDT